jgi:arylsulfatase A-like enzyme
VYRKIAATVFVCALLLLSVGLLLMQNKASTRPNILIFILDDLGYSDFGSYGGEIQTPHIDELAANGLRFTQAYNSGRCWPSRASLLSGYYAQSIRRDLLTGEEQIPFGDRPVWAGLIPEYLRPLGYRSYHSGKWNIDGEPQSNGFDRSYTNMNELGFFVGFKQQLDGKELPLVEDDGKFYETIETGRHALDFLQDHKSNYADRPFFAHVAFNAPHFPLQALPEDIALYKDRYREGWDAIRLQRLQRMREKGIYSGELSALEPAIVPDWNLSAAELKQQVSADEAGQAVPWDSLTQREQDFQSKKMAVHAAMIHRVDAEIGQIVQQLKTMGVFDNTLILVLSDNGASAEQIIRGRGHDPTAPVGSAKTYLGIGPGWSSAANTPFRRHKAWTYEGGIITPLIVHWPKEIDTPGAVRTSPVHVIDVLPTILDLVGAEAPASIAGKPVPALPGISLVPEFSADGAVQHEYLWWGHEGNRAIRIGDWKLVADKNSPWELYELRSDPAETRNVADSHPDTVQDLEKAWHARAKEFAAMAAQ